MVVDNYIVFIWSMNRSIGGNYVFSMVQYLSKYFIKRILCVVLIIQQETFIFILKGFSSADVSRILPWS